MLLTILQQSTVLLAAAVLLGVPGAALTSLLRVREALPDTIAVPAAAVLGALLASVVTGVQLALRQPIEVGIGAYLVVSVVLALTALAVRRRRAAADATVAAIARGWTRWTTAIILVGALFTWLVRGVVKLDALYHIAVTRKLMELSAPSFDNVNRFADGGPNPAYALPGWHAFVGWCSWLTGVDPVMAWEILPVLVVVLGALAAAGLAHVLLDTPRAAPLGALAWVLMRVLFARREVDGDAILFGAVPGQLAFEVVFPVLFAAVAVAMWAPRRSVLWSSLAVAAACIASVVIYHANYLPYVAIVGLGYAMWWLVSGPFLAGAGRRLLIVGGAIAAMCVVSIGAVMPLLASIEGFGETDETRIDYHITETAGLVHIRGGHLYEMLGLPGLIAILAAPIVAWRWRSKELSVASGGLLALITVSVVPPLFEVLRGTGSLTIGLRINHVIGALLTTMFAGMLLLVARGVAARGWTQRRCMLVGAATTVALMATGVGIGYVKFLPEWPGYVAWIGLLVLFASRGVMRLTGRTRATDAASATDALQLATGRLVLGVALVATIGLALPVGAISARRAVLARNPIDAGVQQGDLRCLEGVVARAMADIPAGSIVLSDPAASFRAMAQAPVYVVGDYKIWIGANPSEVVEQLASVNRFFDSSASDTARLELLVEQRVDYVLIDLGDGRWVDPAHLDSPSTRALDAAMGALDRFADYQAYDGGSVARLIARNPERFTRLAVDERAAESALPKTDPYTARPCNSYGLWSVR